LSTELSTAETAQPAEPVQTAQTAVLPVAGPEHLPRSGTYRAAGARCILELAAVLGPLTTLRCRLAVLDAHLVVDDAGHGRELLLEAGVPSLRSNRPLAGRRWSGRRGLDARGHGVLRLESTRIAAVDDQEWRIRARLTLRGTPIDVRLHTRIAARAEDRIALLATGRVSAGDLRRTCSIRFPRTVPATGLRLVLAADFR
jgi:polyisoprenoid-binding protein YceI